MNKTIQVTNPTPTPVSGSRIPKPTCQLNKRARLPGRAYSPCKGAPVLSPVNMTGPSDKHRNYVWLVSRPLAAMREDKLIHSLPATSTGCVCQGHSATKSTMSRPLQSSQANKKPSYLHFTYAARTVHEPSSTIRPALHFRGKIESQASEDRFWAPGTCRNPSLGSAEPEKK